MPDALADVDAEAGAVEAGELAAVVALADMGASAFAEADVEAADVAEADAGTLAAGACVIAPAALVLGALPSPCAGKAIASISISTDSGTAPYKRFMKPPDPIHD